MIQTSRSGAEKLSVCSVFFIKQLLSKRCLVAHLYLFFAVPEVRNTDTDSCATNTSSPSRVKTYLKQEEMEASTRTLAEGCFGKVYKQKFRDNWAAMKKVPVDRITKEQLLREYRVYETARHTNVVKLLGTPWLQDGKVHIPLEFVFGEDLETTIFNTPRSKIHLSESVKAIIISGMCEGLRFLHGKDIVHQDLKPDNIMIEHRSHRAVIIDMGLAKFLKNGLSSAMNMGNEAYSAPEILHGSIRDKRSDVWAMGKIIGELCRMARLPTHGLRPFYIKEVLKDSPYCSVVSRMVVTSAAERTTMAGVIGEIRQIETGAGKPITRLVGAFGPVAHGDLRVMSPFSPEAKRHETPGARLHHRPFPRPPPLAPFPRQEMANIFPRMPFPRPLASDGMVVNHLLEFQQKVTRNGKVINYEAVKITK